MEKLRVMSKIDVIIPCYNYGRFLEECVRSVLDQPVQNIRILIIDDASSDNSLLVANKLAETDRRISVIAHAKNRGHIATYNEGLLDWASAEFSLLLSADDVLTEGALARAIEVLDANPEVGLLYGHALFWHDDRPRPAARTKSTGASTWRGRDWLRIVSRRGHCVTSTPTAVVRTSVQQAIGGYRTDLPHTADVEMWMRFAVYSDVAYIRGVDQAFYRIHNTNMSVQRVPIIDLLQRRAAYDVLFTTHGAKIANASALHREANRRMAKEALWRACCAYHRRRLETTPVNEFVEFARLSYPRIERLPEYWGLRWRQWLGPKISSYLQPIMLSAVHRRVRSWLWWKTFKLRGI
jgi:glycosyltransferase involved in cell wall biosynthesis